MKAARSFHWYLAHPRRTPRLQQREIDADRLWRVLTRHWARRANRPYYGFRVWRVFAQEAS